MIIAIPITPIIGEKVDGFNSCIKKLSLSIPASDRIQEVTVVPILAPIMTPTARESVMIPLFTKPTTITVVAEEL